MGPRKTAFLKKMALAGIVTMAMLVAMAPNHAQTPSVTEKSVMRDGFAFHPTAPVKILVFRPEIKVGEQTTAGLFQPNAEWNEQARKALTDALLAAQKLRSVKTVLQDDSNPEAMKFQSEYHALFRVIVNAAIRHKMFGKDPLPGKATAFDWSLGQGVAQLAAGTDADYGLFLFSHDGFESSGRKAAQLVASLMGGRDTPGSHLGYAALVDLKTGDLLWLNVDLKATGDVRTAEGAASRIEQLLAGFPARAEARP
ncbi:MAG: hypothetical protein ACRCY3_07055 [Sphingorhabdus sp.]